MRILHTPSNIRLFNTFFFIINMYYLFFNYEFYYYFIMNMKYNQSFQLHYGNQNIKQDIVQHKQL